MIVGEFGAARRESQPSDDPIQFGFFGEVFTISDEHPGIGPLMDYAHAVRKGSNLDGLAAMQDLLRACMADGEFDRFWASVLKNRASEELVADVTAKVYEVAAGRPTVRPIGSADGQSTPSPSSSSQSTRRAALGLVPVEQVDLLTG